LLPSLQEDRKTPVLPRCESLPLAADRTNRLRKISARPENGFLPQRRKITVGEWGGSPVCVSADSHGIPGLLLSAEMKAALYFKKIFAEIQEKNKKIEETGIFFVICPAPDPTFCPYIFIPGNIFMPGRVFLKNAAPSANEDSCNPRRCVFNYSF